MSVVHITRVNTNWDMRSIHVHVPGARSLHRKEVVLCLNGRGTIVRLYDALGGIYTQYAPKGEVFDLGAIEQLAEDGIGFRLQRRSHIRLAA